MESKGIAMAQRALKILEAVKALGYYPKESESNKEEAMLAHGLRKAMKEDIAHYDRQEGVPGSIDHTYEFC